MLVKRVVWFLRFMFLFLFVFLLVLFLSSLKNSFVLFCFCVVLFFVTRISGLLVCILCSFFLVCFLLFCFEFCLFLFLSKKDPPKKPDTAKTPKMKNVEKPDKNKKLVQLCSQIVFCNFLGWA